MNQRHYLDEMPEPVQPVFIPAHRPSVWVLHPWLMTLAALLLVAGCVGLGWVIG